MAKTESMPRELVDFIWEELCEAPDRSSPEDQPDMALVCLNDLLVIAENWNERQALRAANSDGGVEPVAWRVDRYGNGEEFIGSEVYIKRPDIRSTSRTDFIPLYAHPTAKAIDGIAVTDLMVRRVCSEAQKWGSPIKADAARALIKAALAAR